MLKHAIRFYTNRIIIAISMVVTLAFVGVFLEVPIDTFKEATWIYSASMQTLATLIALLPISYGYYISNIDNEKTEGFDSYVINRLKSDVYYDMMSVIFFSIFVIVINLVSFFISSQGVFTFFITYLTTLSVSHISVYIYRLFNPNKVGEILKEFDVVSDDSEPNNISLDTFITEYLQLESNVKDVISNEQNIELVRTTPLYDLVDLYSKDYREISENYDRFKEIIFHRNNVIHNYADMQIDFTKYTHLLELRDLFAQYNQAFVQKNIFRNVVSVKNKVEEALREVLSDSTLLQNDVEEEVISTLHSHFVSDYYKAVSDEPNLDIDFEVVQNNFSEHKLVGIEVKSSDDKNVKKFADSFFKRFKDRYVYLISIFYIPKANRFDVFYMTKDKEVRQLMIEKR